MNTPHRTRHIRCSSTIVAMIGMIVLFGGCQATPPGNYGTTGGRMDPSHDSPAERGSLDLGSQDLVEATDRMARDMAARLDINNRANPPRIFVGPIENETTYPEQNYQVFLNRLRAQLTASGTRHGLDVRRERDFVQRMRDREYGYDDPGRSASAYRSDNDYVLTAVINDLPRGRTNYYLIEYQLVQLVDYAESGTNVGPGAIVWSNFYEVKMH